MKQVAPTTIAAIHQALEAAEIDYRSSGMSVLAVAKKHDIPNTTLRRIAKARGWVKGAPQTKAQMVHTALGGHPPVSDSVKCAVDQMNEVEANQDVSDMNSGLAVARKCLVKLLDMVDMVADPRDIRAIVEANKSAIETIRRVRSLDSKDVPVTPMAVDVSDGFAALREAFRKRLAKVDTVEKADENHVDAG